MDNSNLNDTTNVVVSNEQKKKGNKGLIIFLILIILGMGGYITYDKVLKKEEIKKCEKEKCECTKCNVKDKINSKEDTKPNINTADELYKNYLSILKNNINLTYNGTANINENSSNYKEKVYKYGDMDLISGYNMQEGYYIGIKIDSKQNLNISYSADEHNEDPLYSQNKKIEKVDSNILMVFPANSNSGLTWLYYVKDNGKLYYIELRDLYEGNKNIVEIKNIKNVTNIISSSFGAINPISEPIFVDIEGNLYRIGENNSAIKLNK